MQIEIKMDETCRKPKVIILTDKMTDEIQTIIKRLSETKSQMLAGFRNESVEILEENQIYRIFAANGKIYAVTDQGEYLLRLRLYELEERLEKGVFVRISNSEIINLKKVKNFDLNFAGTICVRLSNDTITYVSRRYVAKLKKILGI